MAEVVLVSAALTVMAPAQAAVSTLDQDSAAAPGALSPTEVVDAIEDAGQRVYETAEVTTDASASVGRAAGVAVTIPRDPESSVEIRPEDGAGSLGIGLPGGGDSSSAVTRDGFSIFANLEDQTATAVHPLADGGVQFLLTVGSATSPTRYAFPVSVPEGAELALTEDGGADVAFPDGRRVASIPAPWAVDAAEHPVPTHFEIRSGALVQVVDHTSVAVAYPVLADPSVFSCDFYTHVCVKFTKGETRWIAGKTSVVGSGGIAGVSALCSKVPGGLIGMGACAAAIAAGGAALARSFNSASAKGKCVELHFLFLPPIVTLTRWKTEGC
ncbi:hypothetical protein [Nocardioides terrae]|uniref:hypothetical protein n=1 Tax=Nocardioides terrae TaxID=574651 RepID=UPI0011138255|nr:hypothetical protein [Nocardioides terrae]